jgi:hypothetical protein
MSRMRIGACLAAAFLVAACAQGGNGGTQRSAALNAPGKDWVQVGSQMDAENGTLIITPGNSGVDPDDLTLSLHFGFAVAAHKGDGPAGADGLSLANAGDRPETAYAIGGLAKPEYSVDVALAFIAKLHPSARAVKAYLLNGPGTRYVGQFDFSTTDGPRRVYVDLTPWADAIKAGA